MGKFKTDNKKIAKNTLFLYFRMIIMLVINLYTSRIVLKALGINDFGTYNIVGGLVSMFTFIGGAMIASTQRYLNFYLGKEDFKSLNDVFNVSQIIHLGISLVFIAFCETAGLYYIGNLLSVAPDRYNAAFWAFQCSVISTGFIILSYPYNAAIIAREKMNVFAYITIYNGIAQLIVSYIISMSNIDRLILYATLIMFIQISTTLIYRYYCIKFFNECKLKIKNLPKGMFKELLFFSSWNFLGNIANVCLTHGPNLLLNLFFGPSVNAARGISVQVQNAVSGFCTNFQNAQNPQIVKSYAANELTEMHKLIFRSSKLSFLLMLLLSIPIFLKSEFILDFWLDNPPEYSNIFVKYTILFGIIQSLAGPLTTGSVATGNVKKIMLSIATFFCCIIPIGYIVLYTTNDPVAIFIVQLMMYIIAHIIRVKIVSAQLKFSILSYVKYTIYPSILTLIIAFSLCYIYTYIFPDNLLGVLFLGLSCVLTTLIVIFYVGLENNEKKILKDIIYKKIKR